MSLRPCLVTTVGLFSGIFAATAAFSATAPPLPTALVGTYQGILQVPGVAEAEGLPFGRIEIVSTAGSKATGKLVLIDKKSYPFNITLTANSEGTEATGTGILVNKAATATAAAQSLNLTLVLKSNGTFEASGAAALPTLPASNFEELTGAAFKTPTFVPVKNPCAWIGAYTASFSDVEPAGNGAPTGSGYMTGTTGTNGTMMVTGKLADGTAFTGSMKPSADGRHFLFLTPYTTTVGGYFVTAFQLSQRSDQRWHVAADTDWTKWKKVPYAKDKSHPAGFGPLDVLLTMAQWVAPVGVGNNVGTVMGIDTTEVFGLGIDAVINPTTYARFLPVKLGLNANNTFRVAQGGAGSPAVILDTEWAKILTAKVDPKTGLITMTLKISDTISVLLPRPSSKTINRTVTFNGVFFQLLPTDTSPLASGFVTVPPLATADPTTFGNFAFTGPVTVDPLIASAAGTAGNYTVVVEKLQSGTPPPSNIPANGQTVSFSISRDLKTLKFNGRTIPLVGDSRPVSLVYTDAQKSHLNNLTVTIYTNATTGAVIGLSAMYNQVAVGIPPIIKNQVFVHTTGTIVKLP